MQKIYKSNASHFDYLNLSQRRCTICDSKNQHSKQEQQLSKTISTLQCVEWYIVVVVRKNGMSNYFIAFQKQ